jgi:hypothetical protein
MHFNGNDFLGVESLGCCDVVVKHETRPAPDAIPMSQNKHENFRQPTQRLVLFTCIHLRVCLKTSTDHHTDNLHNSISPRTRTEPPAGQHTGHGEELILGSSVENNLKEDFPFTGPRADLLTGNINVPAKY